MTEENLEARENTKREILNANVNLQENEMQARHQALLELQMLKVVTEAEHSALLKPVVKGLEGVLPSPYRDKPLVQHLVLVKAEDEALPERVALSAVQGNCSHQADAGTDGQ